MSTLTHRDPNRAALFNLDSNPRSHSSSPIPSYGRSSPHPPTYGAPPVPSYGRGPSPNAYSYYGGMAGSAAGPSGLQAHRTAEELESQNDEAIEGLSAKVKMLRDISVNIGAEVKDSSKLLASMNDSFSEASGFLSGTFRRMNKMAKKQGGRWWYWMLFLILVFWIFVFTWLWRH